MSLSQMAQDGMANERAGRLFWTFFDQGIVSAGSFLIQLTLARLLLPHDYGVFTLIFSALLTLQLVNATLLFYPMSVQLPTATDEEKPGLLGASILLVMGLSLLLTLPLAGGLIVFGLDHVLLPALVFFLAWQAQEALRRGLFGRLRHRDALPGDIATYVLPAAVTVAIGLTFSMSIVGALEIMAVCAAIGICLHARALTIAKPSKQQLQAVARSYWQIGGLPSLGNGLLSHTRLFVVPWILAVHAGPAATAGFQAAVNIVNLSNPLIIALGNLIPQIVASTRGRGLQNAWRVTRTFTLIAALPIVVYSLLLLSWPEVVLGLFYGSGSIYLGLEWPLRLLVICTLLGFYVESVISFLHGASLVGHAAEVNLYGTISVLLLALPAILLFGIVGGCLVLIMGNLLRLARAQLTLSTTRAGPCPSATVV